MMLLGTGQADIDTALWKSGDHVTEYRTRTLRPVEAVLLARYRESLSGRILEVGCGAGRLLGYLIALGGEVHGVDVSEDMIAHCRHAYPEAEVRVGDLRELPNVVEGPFDAVFPSFNVLDVLDDAERRTVLESIRELLAPEGLLIFSSHNRASVEPGPDHDRVARKLLARLDRSPSDLLDLARRLPARVRNRRRLAPLQREAEDHAILNDDALDYGLLHYYIRRDDQERQLAELQFELVECLDLEGRRVAPGTEGRGAELHYVARPSR
jgi:SAM-dependent methyltransferase